MAGFIINHIPSLTEDDLTKRFRYLFELKQTEKLTTEQQKEYDLLATEIVNRIDDLWSNNLDEAKRLRKEQWRKRLEPKEIPET